MVFCVGLWGIVGREAMVLYWKRVVVSPRTVWFTSICAAVLVARRSRRLAIVALNPTREKSFFESVPNTPHTMSPDAAPTLSGNTRALSTNNILRTWSEIRRIRNFAGEYPRKLPP